VDFISINIEERSDGSLEIRLDGTGDRGSRLHIEFKGVISPSSHINSSHGRDTIHNNGLEMILMEIIDERRDAQIVTRVESSVGRDSDCRPCGVEGTTTSVGCVGDFFAGGEGVGSATVEEAVDRVASTFPQNITHITNQSTRTSMSISGLGTRTRHSDLSRSAMSALGTASSTFVVSRATDEACAVGG
jgi:hypothetical protein